MIERSDRLSKVEHVSDAEIADQEIATTIVEAIAAAEGVSPLELDVHLGDVVDPDALDRLFVTADGDIRTGYVMFPLDTYLVAVFAAGDVVLYRAD